MADSAERSPGGPDDRTWDDIDEGFFASAPPDIAEPPPEPARFDDLFPPEPPRPDRLAAVRRTVAAAAATTRVSTRRAVVAAATVTRTSTKRAVAHVRGHALPALARARRTAADRFAAAGRFRGVLWSWRPDGRSLAIALTIAVVVGLSGGVIAARGASPPARVLAAAPPAPPVGPAGPASAVAVTAPRAAATVPSAPAPTTAAAEAPPPAPPAVQPPAAPESDAVNEPAVERPAIAKRPRPHQQSSARRHSARNDVMAPTFMSSAPRPPSSGRQ